VEGIIRAFGLGAHDLFGNPDLLLTWSGHDSRRYGLCCPADLFRGSVGSGYERPVSIEYLPVGWVLL
jgi:hypothetical protein